MLFKCLPSDRARVVAALGQPYKEKLTPDGMELRLYFDDKAQAAPAPDGEGILATDAALALATDRNLDLVAIQGSGKGGRILKKDVEALL